MALLVALNDIHIGGHKRQIAGVIRYGGEASTLLDTDFVQRWGREE
jgi:hypothetical protein